MSRPDVVLPRPGPTACAVLLAAVVLAILWSGVVTGTLLAALDPGVDGWIVAVRPPGLVTTAVVISDVGQPAVMIAVLVVVLLGPIRRQALVAALALLAVVAVAASRLVVAVHYPSDVLAGWSLAVIADGIVLVGMVAVRDRRIRRHIDPS